LQASLERGLTRFVGRDAEVDQLREALEQAAGGRGQIVAVLGEPGVGKSRLIYEFMHSHRTQGWLVLESSSASYPKATPYRPLLLVFEALHWIDAETQSLLDALVESLPTASALLAVNYRPEYQHRWGNKSYYRQLGIDTLPPETAEALLETLVGDNRQLQPLLR